MSSHVNENLAPQVIARLMGEIRDLVVHPSDGIQYVESDEASVSEIHAIISGPGVSPKSIEYRMM